MHRSDKTTACENLPESEKALFHGNYGQQWYAARKYCAPCPFRLQCLETALKLGTLATVGTVWGGYTTKQRKAIAKGARLAPPTPLPDDAGPPGKRVIERSQYRGVTRYGNRWRASIKVRGVNHYLGLWPHTPEGEREAAMAYDQAAIELRPEVCELNFPEETQHGEGAGSR